MINGFHRRSLVVVPVKDEVERIGDCLMALGRQDAVQADGVLLLVNNTTDGTVGAVREVRPALSVPVHVVEHCFAPEQASAGSARRMGMERAAAMLGESGVLLTTDADGRVPPDWVAANLWHLRAGADAVAGRGVLHPTEAAAIPPALHEADAEECAYAALLDEIAALLDPEPWDPWPRHSEHSGASIAVSSEAYRRAGGMPAASLAEDRRFFAALRRVDARVRHAPEIAVEVSGRIVGRAEGGMADTIRRRLVAPDPYLDSALEPVSVHVLRVWGRQAFRRGFGGEVDPDAVARLLAARLAVPLAAVRQAYRSGYCGEGWAWLEAMSAPLVRRAVSRLEFEREFAEAERVCTLLRKRAPLMSNDALSEGDGLDLVAEGFVHPFDAIFLR